MIDPISWAFSWPYIAAAALCGYLLGSIPFGLILTRLCGAGDIRLIGSGNIGATNVLRTGKKTAAIATLSLDVAKGAVTVLIAQRYGPDITIVAAGGALLGHQFPAWLRFRGGKGVATAFGILLALSLPVGGLACATWLLTAFVFRYSSLSALFALAATPVFMWWLANPHLTEFSIAMAILVWIRHWQNICRLRKGTEPKLSLSRED